MSIQDEFATGAQNYKEFFWTLVGLAGEGQNFDGNGMYVRFQTGGGTQTVVARPARLGDRPAVRHHVGVPLGNRPAYPGKRPPYKPDVPCYKRAAEPQRAGVAKPLRRRRRPPRGRHARRAAREAEPVRGYTREGDAVRTAIRKHWRDFVAIIVPDRVALAVVGRDPRPTSGSTLPAWVPFVGKDFFVVKAELSTAQAVTPGQGQTVNIAGVEVGEISKRRARGRQGGHRRMQIEPQVRAASTATRPCCCGPRPA